MPAKGPGFSSPTTEPALKPARINAPGKLEGVVEHIAGLTECPNDLVTWMEKAAGLFEESGRVASSVFLMRDKLDTWISQPNFFEKQPAEFIKLGKALGRMGIAGDAWKNAEARRSGARSATERDPIGSSNPGAGQALQSNVGGGHDGKSPAEHFQTAVSAAQSSSSSGKSNETFIAEITAAAVLYRVVKSEPGAVEHVKGNINQLRQTLERDFPNRLPTMTYVELNDLGEAATALGLHQIAVLARFAAVQKHPGTAGTAKEFADAVILAADAFDALQQNSVQVPAEVIQAKDAMEERTNRWAKSAELRIVEAGAHPSLEHAFNRLSFNDARKRLVDENARQFEANAQKVAPRAKVAARQPVAQQGPDKAPAKSPAKSPNLNDRDPMFAAFYKTDKPVAKPVPKPPAKRMEDATLLQGFEDIGRSDDLLDELSDLDVQNLAKHFKRSGFEPTPELSRRLASTSAQLGSIADSTENSESQSDTPHRRRAATFEEKYPSEDQPDYSFQSPKNPTPSDSRGSEQPLLNEKAEPVPAALAPRVQPPAAEPQPAQRTTFQKAKGAARSFANLFTRPEAKRRRVEAQVGKLLRELAKEHPNERQVGAMLAGMPRSMYPLVSGRPQTYDAQFRNSVGHVLESSTLDQLRSLHKRMTQQIANESEVDEVDEVDRHLLLIQAQLAREIEIREPALSPLLREKLIDAATAAQSGNNARAEDHFRAAMATAHALLAVRADGGSAMNLVLNALYRLTTEQDSMRRAVDRLFDALPSDALGEIAIRNPRDPRDPETRIGIRQTARAKAMGRTVAAKVAFDDAGDDPVLLAKAVVTAAQTHRMVIGNEGDEWGTQKLLRPVLETLAAPGALMDLPVDDLVKLDAALASMGIADCRNEIGDAIALHAINELSVITTPITDGQDISGALIAFKEVMLKAKGINFREHLQARVNRAAPAARLRFAMLMQDPRMLELSSGMRKLQGELRRQKYDVEADNLQDLQLALHTIRTAADPFPAARLHRGPAAIGNLESLTPLARTVLLQTCNVEIGPTGQVVLKAGVAPSNVLRALQRSHTKIMEEVAPGTKDPDVADAFRGSVGVHDIRIDGVPLIEDRAQWSQQIALLRTQSRQAGVDQLRARTRGNNKMLRAITNVANATAVAGAMQARFGLLDGTRGVIMGDPQVQCDIVFDASGGCIVKVVFDIKDAKNLVTDGASGSESVVLRKGAFAHLTYEVAISPEGVISVADPAAPHGDPAPMSFKYEAQADEWSKQFGKDYPKPVTGDDLVTPRAHIQVRRELRDQLDREHSDENYKFLDALDRFNENPSEIEATRIWEQYFSPKAPTEVNVAAAVVGAIKNALGQLSSPATPVQLRNFGIALEGARTELEQLVQRDPLARFIKAVEDEPQAPAALPPPVIGDRKTQLTNRDVGHFLHSLSQPLAGDVTVAAEALVHLKKMAKSGFLPWQPGVWRGQSVEFSQLVAMNLKGMKPHRLVALRYNLENNVSPAQEGVMYRLNRPRVKDDPEIKALYAAVVRMLDAMPGATAKTPESVMLASLGRANLLKLDRAISSGKFDEDVGVLAGWLAEGRVSRSEVAAAFAKMPKHALVRIHLSDKNLAHIAHKVLTVRDAGVLFIDDIGAQQPLEDEQDLLNRVVSLAGLFDSYKGKRAESGLAMSKSDERIEQYREEVRDKVEELLEMPQFDIGKLPVASIWELRTAMVILGVDTAFVKVVDDLLIGYANDGAVQAPVSRRSATPVTGRTLLREPRLARTLAYEFNAAASTSPVRFPAGVTPGLTPPDDPDDQMNVNATSLTSNAPVNALSESPADGLQRATLEHHLSMLEDAVRYRAPARLGSPRAAIKPAEFMSDVLAASEFFKDYESHRDDFGLEVQTAIDLGRWQYAGFLQDWARPGALVPPAGVRDLTVESVANLKTAPMEFVSALSDFGVDPKILALFAPAVPVTLPADPQDEVPQLPPQMAQPPQMPVTASPMLARGSGNSLGDKPIVAVPKGSRFGLGNFLSRDRAATSSSTPPRQSGVASPRSSSKSSASRSSDERAPLVQPSGKKPPKEIVATVKRALLAYVEPGDPKKDYYFQIRQQASKGNGLLIALTAHDASWKKYVNSVQIPSDFDPFKADAQKYREAFNQAVESAVGDMDTDQLKLLCEFINKASLGVTSDGKIIMDAAQARLASVAPELFAIASGVLPVPPPFTALSPLRVDIPDEDLVVSRQSVAEPAEPEATQLHLPTNLPSLHLSQPSTPQPAGRFASRLDPRFSNRGTQGVTSPAEMASPRQKQEADAASAKTIAKMEDDVGQLLATLSAGKVNRKSVEKFFEKGRATFNEAHDDFVGAVKSSAARYSLADLQKLRGVLADLAEGAAVQADYDTVLAAVEANISDRLYHAVRNEVNAALNLAGNGQEGVYGDLMGKIQALIKVHDVDHEKARSLLIDSLAWNSPNVDVHRGIRALMQQVPNTELIGIARAEDGVRTAQNLRAPLMELAMVSARRESSVNELKRMKEAGSPANDPAAFARAIIDAAALHQNGPKRDLATLKSLIDELVAPREVNFNSLSDDLLRQLDETFNDVGSQSGSGKTGMTIAVRCMNLQDRYGGHVLSAMGHLSGGNQADALEALKAAEDQAKMIRSWGRQPEMPTEELEEAQVRMFVAALTSRGTLALRSAMRSAASSGELKKVNGALAGEIQRIDEGLQRMLETMHKTLGGAPLPTPSAVAIQNPGINSALRATFGIEISTKGNINVVRGKVVDRQVESLLQNRVDVVNWGAGRDNVQITFESGRGRSVSVAKTMFPEMNAVRVQVGEQAFPLTSGNSPEARIEQLLERIGWGEKQGDDGLQLTKLTHLLNTELINDFYRAMTQNGAPESPFCLPDGTRGIPGGAKNTFITVRRDEQGGFRVNFESHIGQVTVFTTPGGEAIPINSRGSAQLEFEIALGNKSGDPVLVEGSIEHGFSD